MEDVAQHIADFAVTLLCAEIGVIKGGAAVFHVDRLGHVCQLERMRTQLGHTQLAGQCDGFARVERGGAVLRLQVTDCPIILNRDDSCGQALTVICNGCAYSHAIIIKDRRWFNRDIAPAQYLLFGGDLGGICNHRCCTFGLCAVVFNGQQALARLAGNVEEVTLLVVCACVLMGQIDRTRTNRRIGGYRTRIGMRMAGKQQIHLARLDNVRDIALGIRI